MICLCLHGLAISFISHIWSYHSLSRSFLVTGWKPSHSTCCKTWPRGSDSCLVRVWSFHCFCKGPGKLTWVDIVLNIICLSCRSIYIFYFSYLIISLSFSFLPLYSLVTFPSTMLQGMVTLTWFVSCWSVILPLFRLRTRYVDLSSYYFEYDLSVSPWSCYIVYFSYLIISLSFSFLPRNRIVSSQFILLHGMVTLKWFVSCWSVIPPLFLFRTM